MKLIDYISAPTFRRSAIFYGIFTAVCISLFNGWKVGVLSGAITALISSVVLPIIAYVRDLPYIKLKREIKQPFLLDERVHFTVKGGAVQGFLILTEEQMIFLSVGGGTHRLELSRAEVKSIRSDDRVTFRIFVNDTQFIRVMSVASEEIFEILRENNWAVTD